MTLDSHTFHPHGTNDSDVNVRFGGLEREEVDCGICGRSVPEDQTETRWIGSTLADVCDSPECVIEADRREQ